MAENLVASLDGRLRDSRGTQESKHLRQSGRVPAVMYFANDDKTVTSLALDFDEKDIRNLVARRPTLIEVKWGKGEDETRECILRELQRHPVTQVPMHLDLLGVKRGVKIESVVQVRLEGTPAGVKDEGGVLQQIMFELGISALPRDLVNEIVVDVSHMNLNDTIHVSDLDSGNLEFLDDAERTVATVMIPRVVLETVEEEEGEEGEEGVEGEEGEEGEGAEDSDEKSEE